MTGSAPRPGAETTSFPPDRVVQGATNPPNPPVGSSASGNDGSGDLRPEHEMARIMDPNAWDDTFPMNADRRVERQDASLGYAIAAIDAGYRRVVVDDTTVERVAEALWQSDIEQLPGVPDGDWDRNAPRGAKEHFRAQARAAVRAVLGEDQP